MHKETKIVETSLYIAEDGQKFVTVEACERHERKRRNTAIRKQIRTVHVNLDDDLTHGFPYDAVKIMAIQTVAQWEAWAGHTFPAAGTFVPFLSLEYLEYLEEVTDRCGDRNYETCTMDPGDLADTLEQHAKRSPCWNRLPILCKC